jgi:glycosyltransferase involved in cell wall biosynthesis
VRRIIRQIDPDIVHGQGTERDCAMAAVLSGYPNVLTLHGNMRVLAKRPENRRKAYYRMVAMLESFCLKRTHGLIAISTYTRDLVANMCARTWLLPNAVDERFFVVTPEPTPVPRFLVVGSIIEWKNPVGLIEACEPMLREGACTIAFAGQGSPSSPYVQHFNRLVRELPGLELLGFLDRDELARQFARSTAVVLPTFEDNCPMVVLEGMAAGLPVAASRVGGVPDLIEDGVDGLLFDPTKPDTIRDALDRLCQDPALRGQLAGNARKAALKRFHPKVIAERHLEIYREVLGW